MGQAHHRAPPKGLEIERPPLGRAHRSGYFPYRKRQHALPATVRSTCVCKARGFEFAWFGSKEGCLVAPPGAITGKICAGARVGLCSKTVRPSSATW